MLGIHIPVIVGLVIGASWDEKITPPLPPKLPAIQERPPQVQPMAPARGSSSVTQGNSTLYFNGRKPVVICTQVGNVTECY